MRKHIVITLVLATLIGTFFMVGQNATATAKELKIQEFDSMTGLPPAFTGTQRPIRGVNGGGLPWEIGPSHGELTAGGKLEISVQGLVFSAGPNTGSNTIPAFRATVSCLTSGGDVENVSTDPFPATMGPASAGGGNTKIETTLSLPQPCIAPIIFVTSPGGAWFAITGS